MEGHSVLGDELVNGSPPIELAHWRRVPGIPVGMMGVCDPRGEIIFREGATQTGYVLVRLFRRAAESLEYSSNKLLRTGVVDISRLERREELDTPLDRELLMGPLRIDRGERILDHFASVLD